LDPVGVSLVAFMLVGKNPFEPMGLPLGRSRIRECVVLGDDELLAALVTAEYSHFLEARDPYSA
jgi:hypothetical protein